MIPREFFDWVIVQWWGPPAFVVLVISAISIFSWGLALSVGYRDR